MFLFRWATAPLRWTLRAVLTLISVVIIYLVVTLVQVWLTSREYAPVPAGAIVIMGAAQYDGRPSPDLRARLNEALILFRQKYADLIVCTGSRESGDAFTEAQAEARYLKSHGVPADELKLFGGNDSWENLALAAPWLRAKGDTTVLVVTDPFHEDRSMAIATDVGLSPHPTPTRTSPISGTAVIPYFLKETVGVAVGRIIGYQHLHSLFG